MQQSADKNNWLQIVTDRLSRRSGAGIVEISIRYEDITARQWQMEPGGDGIVEWVEDWLGKNVWGMDKSDLVHLARLTVIELAKQTGWLVVKDGIEVITLKDGQRKCERNKCQ